MWSACKPYGGGCEWWPLPQSVIGAEGKSWHVIKSDPDITQTKSCPRAQTLAELLVVQNSKGIPTTKETVCFVSFCGSLNSMQCSINACSINTLLDLQLQTQFFFWFLSHKIQGWYDILSGETPRLLKSKHEGRIELLLQSFFYYQGEGRRNLFILNVSGVSSHRTW